MARILDDLPVLNLRRGDGFVLVRMGRGCCAKCGGRARGRWGPAASRPWQPVRIRCSAACSRRRRRPRTSLASTTTLNEMLAEIIAWIDEAIKNGAIW